MIETAYHTAISTHRHLPRCPDRTLTNIYSKEAAKEMAKASLAMKTTQEVPAGTFDPTGSISTPPPVRMGVKRTLPAVLIGFAAAQKLDNR